MYYWRWVNRPRHPLLRVLLAALGIVVLAGILALGLFALIAFALIGGVVALVRAISHPSPAQDDSAQPSSGASESRVIDGEYVIVHQDTAPLEH